MPPTAQDFQRELDSILVAAQRQGKSYVDVKSGDLHRRVGGDPGPNHRMPTCCGVMKRNTEPGDRILQEPPSGMGANGIIRYNLPRGRKIPRAPSPWRKIHIHVEGKTKQPAESVLVIVPCGKGKIWEDNPAAGEVPAAKAYVGAPFKVNSRYARHFADRWVILSAKYGFIPPDFLIPGPYDVTFKHPETHPISIADLRQQVDEQDLARFELVIGLGGRDYRQVIRKAFQGTGVQLEFPFAGLPIGKAMHEINLAIDRGEPLPSRG